MARYRVVIKDLREPRDTPSVSIGGNLSKRDADAMQKRFTKCKWDERRLGILTIDHVALVVEPEEG